MGCGVRFSDRFLGGGLLGGCTGRLLRLGKRLSGLLPRGLGGLGLAGKRLAGRVASLLGQILQGVGHGGRCILGHLLRPLGHLLQADRLLRIRLLRRLRITLRLRPVGRGPLLFGPHLRQFRCRFERLGLGFLASRTGLLRLRLPHVAAGLGHVSDRLGCLRDWIALLGERCGFTGDRSRGRQLILGDLLQLVGRLGDLLPQLLR